MPKISKDPPSQKVETIEVEAKTLPPATQPTELMLIMQAIEKFGGEHAESGVAVIKELSLMKREQERWDAEKEFIAQMAEFQQECPSIKKVKKVEVSSAGGKYDYNFSPLSEIVKVIKPLLHHRGFFFTWTAKTENKEITMTCFLRHKNGHSISTEATAPIPEKMAALNAVQIPAGVRTYLERQTLIQVLGLTNVDDDRDGADPTTIDAEQAIDLQKKVKASGMDEATFLEYVKAKQYTDILKSDYRMALMTIRQGQQAKELREIRTKIEPKNESGELKL